MRRIMRFRSRAVVLATSAAVFLALASRFTAHVSDDAFISFRYAENLVQGHGLVFNPGERVEGYTNFLWVMLVAPFIALSIEPELAASVLGICASLALLAGVVRLSPAPESAPWILWIAPLLCATSPPLAVWATGGLEAPLFACLVVWAAALTSEAAARGALHAGAALLAAAAALTRPEGLAVGALLLGVPVARGARRPRDVARWCAVFLAVFVPYFAWRFSYYGDPLPNTFYAKVGLSAAQVLRGLRYAGLFVAESGYLLLLPLVGLSWRRNDPALGILATLACALTAYVVLIGGDGLPMFRFLVPVLPLFYLLLGRGFAGAVERSGAGRAARTVALVLALALGARAALPAFAGQAARLVEADRREVAAWKEIGHYFAENAPRDASIAVITAGAIPYFSGLESIDMLGLNERAIARRAMPGLGSGAAGHEKFDVEHVLDRRPTYVVLGTYGLAPDPLPPERILRPFYPAEIEMLRSERFRRDYLLVRARTPSGYFAHFVRKDATERGR
jgi:hypothetical protein